MKVLITGATGTIGSTLITDLIKNGIAVAALTRNKESAAKTVHSRAQLIEWDDNWKKACGEIDVVINLAGEPIVNRRWSQKVKKRLYDSRIDTTKTIVDAIKEKAIFPRLLLNASAIGYYDYGGDNKPFTESDTHGESFLSDLCVNWEKEALEAEKYNVRVILMRIGIVLSKTGGTLKTLLPIFSRYLGGPIGAGKQWFSWIHVDDICKAVNFFIENDNLSGPFNLVSSNPVTNKQFTEALAKAIRKPAIFPVPEFVLKLRFGELAEVMVKSQKIYPKNLLDSGFTFAFPEINNALQSLLSD